jgi:AmiR/NasT family two-component response regulator
MAVEIYGLSSRKDLKMSPKKEIDVLIAEDDPLVSEMIRGILEDLGYIVAGEAADGQQVIELTQRLQPDVIVMDIEMPQIDGIEATRRIHKFCPIPVVILTAYETPGLIEQASAAGVGAYLIKPPKMRDLDRAITIALARFSDMLQLRRLNAELQTRNDKLQAALTNMKTLRGLLPICASCKRIRDDHGYWQQVEIYIREHSEADFTTGICPECAKRLYPDYYQEE